MIRSRLAACLLPAALLLAGCGGGTAADLSGTGFKSVTGEVTSLDGLAVNGTTYDSSAAAVSVEGRSATLDALAVGMLVTLEFGDDGRLTAVRFANELRGPVESIDLDNGEITVLGQVVRFDPETNFDGLRPKDLSAGQHIEVSGAEGASGRILASWIAGRQPEDGVELKGVVAALDAGSMRFRLGALEVDYGSAQLEDLPGGAPANGLRVEVEGVLDSSGVLIADSVTGRPRVTLPREDEAAEGEFELAGPVQALADDRLTLLGVEVRITADTVFDEAPRDALAVDVHVVIEGEVRADGVLLAEEIRIRRPADAGLRGRVEAIDADNRELILFGGVRVQIPPGARLDDDSDADNRRFGFADLGIGDRVRISGREDAEALVVSLLEREDDDAENEDELRAAIGQRDEADRSFLLRGVTVRITDATEFDGYADEADFFASAQPGDRVEAKGQFDAGSGELIAGDIERLDDRDDAGAAARRADATND